MHVPIFVERGVMDAAGIIPEDDLQEESSEPIQDQPETEIEEDADDRLSVFQDFLENLDINSSDDQEDGEELGQ